MAWLWFFAIFSIFIYQGGCEKSKEILTELEIKLEKQERQEHKQLAEQAVYDFMKKISPTLYVKTNKIIQEKNNAHNTIMELIELKEKHPYQANKINDALIEWRELERTLEISSDRIYEEAEEAYVVYKVNGLITGKEFEKKLIKLSNIADLALEEAKITSEVVRISSTK